MGQGEDGGRSVVCAPGVNPQTSTTSFVEPQGKVECGLVVMMRMPAIILVITPLAAWLMRSASFLIACWRPVADGPLYSLFWAMETPNLARDILMTLSLHYSAYKICLRRQLILGNWGG